MVMIEYECEFIIDQLKDQPTNKKKYIYIIIFVLNLVYLAHQVSVHCMNVQSFSSFLSIILGRSHCIVFLCIDYYHIAHYFISNVHFDYLMMFTLNLSVICSTFNVYVQRKALLLLLLLLLEGRKKNHSNIQIVLRARVFWSWRRQAGQWPPTPNTRQLIN